MGSKPNRAEQKQRQNVIENPLRRSGEKSREERVTTGVGDRGRPRTGGSSSRFLSCIPQDLSVDISCVHTVERTRSIVNGRLMEWNSHLHVLSSYTQPSSSFPFLQPCVRIVKLLPAHCRCFPFMAPDMVDLIRIFLFLLLFLLSACVFSSFRPLFNLSSLSLFLNSGF